MIAGRCTRIPPRSSGIVEGTLKPGAKRSSTTCSRSSWRGRDRSGSCACAPTPTSPTRRAIAVAFGAEGIGLCRTEHMFFGEAEDRRGARDDPRRDDGGRATRRWRRSCRCSARTSRASSARWPACPSRIRTLDPPLHEFLPHDGQGDRGAGRRSMGVTAGARLQDRVESLHELNPMLGHRGCRLGIIYPGDHGDAGARHLRGGRATSTKEGQQGPAGDHDPARRHVKELREQAQVVRRDGRARSSRSGRRRCRYLVGTMIELPRAALTADRDRGDGRVLQLRHERPDADDVRHHARRRRQVPAVLPGSGHPARSIRSRRIDRDGVGALDAHGSDEGPRHAPEAQGGDLRRARRRSGSVAFCHGLGLDYVSCSPFRVPIARLAAAQAEIAGKAAKGGRAAKSASAKASGKPKAAGRAKSGKKAAARLTPAGARRR